MNRPLRIHPALLRVHRKRPFAILLQDRSVLIIEHHHGHLSVSRMEGNEEAAGFLFQVTPDEWRAISDNVEQLLVTR